MSEEPTKDPVPPAESQCFDPVDPFPDDEIFQDPVIERWNDAYRRLGPDQKKVVWSDDHVKLFWQHGLHIDGRFNTRFGLMAAFQGLLFNAYVGALAKGLDSEVTGKGSPRFFLLALATAILGAVVSCAWLYIQRGHSEEVRAATRTAMWLYNIGKMPHYRVVRTAQINGKRLIDRTQLLLASVIPACFILLWIVGMAIAVSWRPAAATTGSTLPASAGSGAPVVSGTTSGPHP